MQFILEYALRTFQNQFVDVERTVQGKRHLRDGNIQRVDELGATA